MSNVYYWSDLHLAHEFVAGTRGFDGTMDHDKHIIDAWRSRVTKRDTVWLLGDLTLGSPKWPLELLDMLPGTKHLIFGNHDAAHPMHRSSYRQQPRYLHTFASVQTMARHRIGGRDVLLSHFPYAGDHGDQEERYSQYRLRDEGLPLIHGHVHDEWKVRGAQINVGVDHWMDGPASYGDLADILSADAAAA